MRSFRFALTAFGLLPVALAVACSSSSNTNYGNFDSGSDDAATNDAAPSDGGTGGAIPKNIPVVIAQTGGFTAGAPDGSTCQPIDDTYTLDRMETFTLSWKLCRTDDAGLASFTTGSRVLTDVEQGKIEDLIDAVTIDTQKVACASDGPTQSISFQSADGGTTTYYDETENCLSGETFADGVGAVAAEASELAHD